MDRLLRWSEHAQEGRSHRWTARDRRPDHRWSSSGASWSTDDTIIFGTNDPTSGLLRVAAAGGEPEVLTTPNRDQGELDHMWPEVLPGGQAVLFTIETAAGLTADRRARPDDP